ncbi:MAG: hypothetical protein R2741_14520 [Methanolobus sp.]
MLSDSLQQDETASQVSGEDLYKSNKLSTQLACLTEADDFNHFNVSSYADSYPINKVLDEELATSASLDLMSSIKSSIIDMNPEFLGHLKMFFHTKSLALRISVTSYNDQPEFEIISAGTTDENQFTVFAAVTDVERDNLADIIENAVSARSSQFGIVA